MKNCGPEQILCKGWNVLSRQLDWYRKQIASLKGRCCDQTAIFLHIPIYAYRPAYQAAFPAAPEPKAVTLAQSYGADCWDAAMRTRFVWRMRKFAPIRWRMGVFDVVQKLHATQNIVADHGHTNNWVVNYEGVRFICATKNRQGAVRWMKRHGSGRIGIAGASATKPFPQGRNTPRSAGRRGWISTKR